MIIEHYISDLLYRHQCVIVPNWGAFISETISAQLNDNNTFTPPKKVITFNANIQNNDGLLANHIASNEKISFEKAVQKIEWQVLKWQNRLVESNSVSLAKIGTLVINNADKSLFFSPDSSTNYLTSSFGLSQFTSPSILREVYVKEVKKLEEVTPIMVTEERKQNKLVFLKYAAVLAVLGTIGLWGFKQYHDQNVAQETLLVQKKVQTQVVQKLQQATFFMEVPSISVEFPVVEEKLSYHIISGAFRSETNAHKALRQLHTQGFEKAQVLPVNKAHLFPVAFGSFRTLEEAKKMRNQLHYSGYLEAWLMID